MADTARLLRAYADAISRHDWPGLRAVLDDAAQVTLLHTGERFDPDGYVAFNRDYPGGWELHVEEVVDGGDRGVLRARVEQGGETFHVATFASTAPSSGRLADVVEVWTEAVAPHPERA